MAGSTSYFFLIILGFCFSGTQGFISGDLRLVGNSEGSSGRLEVYYNETWGTVCGDFSRNDARVACRQLGYAGYTRYGIVTTFGFPSASVTTPNWLYELHCLGTESRLIDCPANPIGSEDCRYRQKVALICSANGDLRLVIGNLGRTGSSGRLEVYYSGQWGTVCDDNFGSIDATVACRQLGYTIHDNYGQVGTLGFPQPSSTNPIWLDELRCTGTESRLIDCPANAIGVEDCTHTQDVALTCISNGDLRLVDNSGQTKGSSGRLEVYSNGQWGTVCDDRFGLYEARVACRQMGHIYTNQYGQVRTLGFSQASSSTRTWLDKLRCLGTESRLIDCPRNAIGVEDCTHTQDVALVCVPYRNLVLGYGHLRLVGSNSETNVASGRLEVQFNGEWGTVCDDKFSSNDARVACRQLGFSDYTNYGQVETLGFVQSSLTTRTWLDELRCLGTERRLIDCPRNDIGVEDCTHTQDVALVCTTSNGLLNGRLRLVGSNSGTNVTSGRLEVYYNGQWGTVCDDSFGPNDAIVACRQLEFSSYTQYGRVGTLGFFQSSLTTRTWLDELRCRGTETKLIDCPANTIGVEDCTHTQDVALVCTGLLNGRLRLVGSNSGINVTSGRLEVYYNGQWGTVCDNSFGIIDARVACRQLGFSTYTQYGRVGTLGFSQASSSTRTWLGNLRCRGTEDRLINCPASTIGVGYCTHTQDVALVCTGFITTSGGGDGGSNIPASSGGSAGSGVSGIFGYILIICSVFCCM